MSSRERFAPMCSAPQCSDIVGATINASKRRPDALGTWMADHIQSHCRLSTTMSGRGAARHKRQTQSRIPHGLGVGVSSREPLL